MSSASSKKRRIAPTVTDAGCDAHANVDVNDAKPTEVVDVNDAKPTEVVDVNDAMPTEVVSATVAMPTEVVSAMDAMPTEVVDANDAMPIEVAGADDVVIVDVNTVHVDGMDTVVDAPAVTAPAVVEVGIDAAVAVTADDAVMNMTDNTVAVSVQVSEQTKPSLVVEENEIESAITALAKSMHKPVLSLFASAECIV